MPARRPSPAGRRRSAPGRRTRAAQTLTFIVTEQHEPALFSAAPAVAPTGTLTYTPAANADGTATITLTLQDNGGTANGGVDTSRAADVHHHRHRGQRRAELHGKGANQTVLEDAGAQTVAGWATAISAGPANEAAQTRDVHRHQQHQPGLFSAGAGGVADRHADLHAGGQRRRHGDDHAGRCRTTAARPTAASTRRAPQTFTITVTGINDAPSFTAGRRTRRCSEDCGRADRRRLGDGDQRRARPTKPARRSPSSSRTTTTRRCSRRARRCRRRHADLHAGGQRQRHGDVTLTLSGRRRHRQRRRRHRRRRRRSRSPSPP